MPDYVYITERRKGARRQKTPYQALEFWIKASGAKLVSVPIGKSGSLTVEAWKLPDGRIVDAVLISDEKAESHEFLERVAESIVKDHSAENLKRLEQLLRDRENKK